ncbi:MAG: hypothetical protein AAGA59_24985 [Actinomycetota bacterium]
MLTPESPRRFRRARPTDPTPATLIDLSVTGASLTFVGRSPATMQRGGRVTLTLDDHEGTARIKHACRDDDVVVIGVEFAAPSDDFAHAVHAIVDRCRGSSDSLRLRWEHAR